jgi:tRNA(Ile)-lysidine synthase
VSVAEVRQAVRDTGLLGDRRPVVAMLSGGSDSVCLLDVAIALRGVREVRALHVNYGLRESADADERHCVELCELLGVALSVQRAGPAPGRPAAPPDDERAGATERAAARDEPGNLQAWARELRYTAARRLADPDDAAIATGHTASDQVETILYRLAASPGRRALLGMASAEGSLIRPLLAVTREQTAAYCAERGLRWREDESNEDERYARVRVRRGLVPALRAVHPAAEANVLRTASLLGEETELLQALVDDELAGGSQIALARLADLPAALARMIVVRLAEDAAQTYVPQAGERVGELLALGKRGGHAELHLGRFAGAVIDDGVLSTRRLAPRETSERLRTPPGEH